MTKDLSEWVIVLWIFPQEGGGNDCPSGLFHLSQRNRSYQKWGGNHAHCWWTFYHTKRAWPQYYCKYEQFQSCISRKWELPVLKLCKSSVSYIPSSHACAELLTFVPGHGWAWGWKQKSCGVHPAGGSGRPHYCVDYSHHLTDVHSQKVRKRKLARAQDWTLKWLIRVCDHFWRYRLVSVLIHFFHITAIDGS